MFYLLFFACTPQHLPFFSADPKTVDPTATMSWNGAASSYFGYSITFADVDADGYEDAVVGAYAASNANGEFSVYPGSSSGLSASASVTVKGNNREGMGGKVASVGDVNGDSYPDVGVVSFYADNTWGHATIYYGSAKGISATNYDILDAAAVTVAGLGDVDGDGYDDVAVGASSGAGGATVFMGAANAIQTSEAMHVVGPANEYFGATIVGADLNGDGYADMIVGAPDYDSVDSGKGKVSVYLGSATGMGSTVNNALVGTNYSSLGYALANAGDLNGDGYTDLAIGAPVNGGYVGAVYVYEGGRNGIGKVANTTLNGVSMYDKFGASLAAGDTNGDGYSDLVVGSPSVIHTGDVKVFLGASGGLSSTEDSTLRSAHSLGQDLACGDVGNDGLADVLASDNVSTNTAGSVYLFSSYTDADGDGHRVGAGGDDCDDTEKTIYPGAAETDADGVDSDCDGAENCYLDGDKDGYRTDTLIVSSDGDCSDPGEALSSQPTGDCDDNESGTNPDAAELCDNGTDDNCDGSTDEGCDSGDSGTDSDPVDSDPVDSEAEDSAPTDSADDPEDSHPDSDGRDKSLSGCSSVAGVPGISSLCMAMALALGARRRRIG